MKKCHILSYKQRSLFKSIISNSLVHGLLISTILNANTINQLDLDNNIPDINRLKLSSLELNPTLSMATTMSPMSLCSVIGNDLMSPLALNYELTENAQIKKSMEPNFDNNINSINTINLKTLDSLKKPISIDMQLCQAVTSSTVISPTQIKEGLNNPYESTSETIEHKKITPSNSQEFNYNTPTINNEPIITQLHASSPLINVRVISAEMDMNNINKIILPTIVEEIYHTSVDLFPSHNNDSFQAFYRWNKDNSKNWIMSGNVTPNYLKDIHNWIKNHNFAPLKCEFIDEYGVLQNTSPYFNDFKNSIINTSKFNKLKRLKIDMQRLSSFIVVEPETYGEQILGEMHYDESTGKIQKLKNDPTFYYFNHAQNKFEDMDDIKDPQIKAEKEFEWYLSLNNS